MNEKIKSILRGMGHDPVLASSSEISGRYVYQCRNCDFYFHMYPNGTGGITFSPSWKIHSATVPHCRETTVANIIT